MDNSKARFIWITLFLGLLLLPGMAAAETAVNDSVALQGVKESKVIFDVNLSKAAKLEFYLRVIKQTYADLQKQGQKPEMIIAFRGSSVRLINTETWMFSDEDQADLAKSAAYLKELHDLGVRIEACGTATRLFKIKNDKLLPGIEVVGNTFVSLIAYQSKGYSLIPIQ